jgi:hypothetical protein
MMTASNLPFELEAHLPQAGATYELEIILHRAGASQESLDALNELVTVVFAASVNAHMFCAQERKVIDPHLHHLASSYDPSNDSWRHLFKAIAVPPAAFLVLASMLAQSRLWGTPLQRLTMQALGKVVNPVGARQLLSLTIENGPVAISQLPFAVQLPDRYLPGGPVILEFYFTQPVTREFAEQLEKTLNIWDHLVILGGFRFDFKKQEDFWPHFGRTAHISPTLIKHTVDRFEAPVFALNLIFNFAAVMHAQGNHLNVIAIE